MEKLRRLWRGRTMTFGVPLLLYLVGGSLGLREFAQIRYDVHKLHGKICGMPVDLLHHDTYCELLDESGLLQADLFILFEDLLLC
ncbi:cytochrome c oxidase assembly protein COX16 homolog, mitochondrial isoform X3 [Anomalospiza imberbis]|uniref:cytochrome c oxidase assembly protein COX16 homolog, mitochondrial isoform X3 n=1 Tax=Anomalospiza imberbis TaxID=187417 RepID=UPI00358FF8F5